MAISRSITGTIAVAAILVVAPSFLGAQEPQLLVDARAQLARRNLDSAITLFGAVASDQHADSSVRAEALMWRGVAFFYKGQDSSGHTDFREALRHDPLLLGAPALARLDPALADWWEREQTLAVCGEALPAWGWPPGGPSFAAAAMNADARAGEAPVIVSGPHLSYPDGLRSALIQGRVLARLIVDTSGNTERGSVRIITAAHRGFRQPVIHYAERARFNAAVFRGVRVRSCVVLPVDFKLRGVR